MRTHLVGLLLVLLSSYLPAQVLDKAALLKQQTYFDNRDFDWYEANIPFFECSNADITTTYYYRWELLTKHLTYGSPNSGYSFTEFIDRPFWSGAYGAISCPAGHQLYEARWLRSPRIANDYARYWFRTPGAQPRNYSTWLADAVWATDLVHPNKRVLIDLLPDLIANYEGWEKRHFVPEVGLFWQTGHDDGMEFNINSRQTQDILRGAPSYRPSFNAYMWADAKAIARIAKLAGKPDIAERFDRKADALKSKMIELMWDERRQFFFPVLKNNEQRDGHQLKALTRTYESGQFAGDSHGRELIGYVPWEFSMFEGQGEHRFDVAWQKLMDRDGFFSDFGPSTVERNDPMFLLQKSCCWWSGQSWPYATTQTLKGLANHLQNEGKVLSAADYVKLLDIYARSHRKDGRPYLAEALHPDTGSFEGHDGYNHSEHYFHSGYVDLVITGLVGVMPSSDGKLHLHPLAPVDWDYFAIDGLPYAGRLLTVFWDKSGQRYQRGAGLHVLVDGQEVFRSTRLEPATIDLRQPEPRNKSIDKSVDKSVDKSIGSTNVVLSNFAVNNDGTYYPHISTSITGKDSSAARLIDGNYWYLQHPPNRWTSEGTSQPSDWIEVDFGVVRTIETVKLYVLDDRELKSSRLRAPERIGLQVWQNNAWQDAKVQSQSPAPEGHRPHVFHLEPLATQKVRVTLVHAPGSYSGLTELEVWGLVELPIKPVPPPAGNLAYNDGSHEVPRATSSHHDRFGGVPKLAIDGITNFLPTPVNRWTSYESKSKSDWLEIDFGKAIEFRRVELAIYDDRGGVQPPVRYSLERWDGQQWFAIEGITKSPSDPIGNQWNSANFAPVTASKLRLNFEHKGNARSGVTEVMVWNE